MKKKKEKWLKATEINLINKSTNLQFRSNMDIKSKVIEQDIIHQQSVRLHYIRTRYYVITRKIKHNTNKLRREKCG